MLVKVTILQIYIHIFFYDTLERKKAEFGGHQSNFTI
jgi:hypothetical protein